MKHILIALASLTVLATSLPAQQPQAYPPQGGSSLPTIEGFMQRTEMSNATLIENSNEILQRLGGLEASVKRLNATGGTVAAAPEAAAPAAAGGPTQAQVDALEARLKQLEAKLAAPPPAPAAPAPAAAAPAAAPIDSSVIDTLKGDINAVWIVATAAWVFFMKAGFCMLEVGVTRAKNAINICMKNFLDFCIGSICFLFVGFGLMFGTTHNGLFGTGPFWLSDTFGANSPLWSFWFFQLVFCGTAATIVSGALAERTKFMGYLIFIVFMMGAIYPIAGHWAWGSIGGPFGYGGTQGWLEAKGFKDFAGSTVVHCMGGAASLAGIIVVGARYGRFKEDGTPVLIAGHNLPMATLGTFILWFGWYGFNPGSSLEGAPLIGRIATNTTIAPCAGAVAAMAAAWLLQGRPDLGLALNGALAGLVAITANCNIVVPASGVLIGLIAGLIATFATTLLEKLRLDDPVGAVPVHLSCGLWGTVAEALFNEEGFSWDRLAIQGLGTLAITGFVFVAAYIVFQAINMIMGLRVSDQEQELGLDFTEHSANAYPDFVTSDQGVSNA